jgi:hypothetical protein
MNRSNGPEPGAVSAATHQNVILAMARQRLGDAHFQFVLELIRQGQGEVAAPHAVDIYARLHHLDESDLQTLRNRVLVYAGQVANTDVTQLPNTFVSIEGAVEWDITASLVKRIRKRLGGRRNHDFREFVELHGGYVEARLLRIHIDNVVGLREATDPESRLADIVRLYIRHLGLRESIFEPLYNGFLERLYESAAAHLDEQTDLLDQAGDDEDETSASVA